MVEAERSERARMSQNEQPIEWYLARDGKQHGPVNDTEMRKIVELGHLRPTDLVWRQGFAEWTQAGVAFPAPTPRPAAPPAAPPVQQPKASQPPAPRAPTAAPTPAPARPAPEPQRDLRPTAPTFDARPQRAPSPGGGGQQPIAGPAPAPINPLSPAARMQAPQQFQPHPHPQPMQPARTGEPQRWQPGQPGPAGGMAPPPGQPAPRPLPVPPVDGPALDDAEEPRRKRRFPWKSLAALIVLGALGGGGYALHKSGRLSLSALPFISGSGASTARAPKDGLKESPLKSFAGTSEEVDSSFQKAALWQLIKREFPDWYKERLQDTVRLRSEKKDDAAIAGHLTQALIDLRRRNVDAALAASPERLKFVAAAFVENLSRLAKHSTDACYGFISQGESSPVIIELMRSSDHTAALQTQFTAIFEAIAEGRKTPKAHAQPKREDYDVLAAQLAQRGWSPADLQVFSDARALSRAKPERVCQMVQDWFAAQLAVKDEAVQIRLLVEALKPVVAG